MSQSQLDRIKLLMGYSLKKTYTENLIEQNQKNLTKINKKNLKEQSVIGAPSYGTVTYTPEDNKAWIEEYKANCGNNPNLLVPTVNKYGAKGADAVIKQKIKNEDILKINPSYFDNPMGIKTQESVKQKSTIKEQNDDWKYGIQDKNMEALGLDPTSHSDYVEYRDMLQGDSKKEEDERPDYQEIQYCLYRAPKIKQDTYTHKNVETDVNSPDYMSEFSPSVPAIWISSLAIPSFFTEENIDPIVQGVVDQISNSPESLEKGFNSEEIKKNLRKLIKPGDLSGFLEGNKNYALVIQRESINKYSIVGYQDMTSGGRYTTPDWVDPRSDWDRFIDSYGIYVQLGAAIIIGVLGGITGGAAWVFYAEIGVEGILGLIVAQREFEKGEYVSAAFSIIFGALPIAKLNLYFKGVKPETFRSLSEKLAKHPDLLKSESGMSDLIKNVLSKDEAELFQQALKRDEVTWIQLKKEAEALGTSGITKQAKKDAIKFLEKNPNLINEISWYRRIWAREWGANIGLMTISIVLEFTLGEELNDKTKGELENIYAKIPESLQKEVTYNLAKKPEVLKETVTNMSEKFVTVEKTQSLSGNLSATLQAYRSAAKVAVEENGTTYEEIEEDPTKGEGQQNKPTTQEEKKYRSEGWIPDSEYNKEVPPKKAKFLGDVLWVFP